MPKQTENAARISLPLSTDLLAAVSAEAKRNGASVASVARDAMQAGLPRVIEANEKRRQIMYPNNAV